MGLLDDTSIKTIQRIYSWGSRSVHESQMAPIHLIWICLYYIFDFVTEEIVKPVQISKEGVKNV